MIYNKPQEKYHTDKGDAETENRGMGLVGGYFELGSQWGPL